MISHRKLASAVRAVVLIIIDGNSEYAAYAGKKNFFFQIKTILFVTVFDLIEYLREIKKNREHLF